MTYTKSFYLKRTPFCDPEELVPFAKDLCHDLRRDEDRAVRIFNWVRDNVLYELGMIGNTATQTLERRSGSCTNKANLLVALARSVGIPAAFLVMRVRTKQYFGELCTPRFSQFMSNESFHVSSAVRLNGLWLRCDATDDLQLSAGSSHLCRQSKLVCFDGENDALLNLDPLHVVSEDPTFHSDVDDILARKPKVPQVILRVMNHYLGFIRSFGPQFSRPLDLEKDFFVWLKSEHPLDHEGFVNMEERMAANSSGRPERQDDHGQLEY